MDTSASAAGGPPEPALDAAEQEAFQRGVAQFNDGFFFECHDTLEDLWAGLRGPSRDFFQGLIQVSVAFYHLGNGNPAGARSLLTRALARFERYPARYFGFDLAEHRAELLAWRAQIEKRASGFTPAQAPKWRFEPRQGAAAAAAKQPRPKAPPTVL